MDQQVYYHAIYRTPAKLPPATGMFCQEKTRGPLRTVFWSSATRQWVFNRAAGGRFLADDEKTERKTVVTRTEAERIAREELGTELPTEAEIHQIVLRGEAGLLSP